ENIVLQAPPGGVAEALERATSVFPILGSRLGQLAGTLSGGEQQMLALARAYVSRPQVVLLDEVSMGLAPRIVDEIFAFLRLLAAEGTALLIVEQYVARAMELADYLFVLNRGEVSFAGQPSEVDLSDILADYLGGHAVPSL
ncbi:MAG: ATP-binding cassette domain-containing protein, partial [Mycobacteriales bacterium]